MVTWRDGIRKKPFPKKKKKKREGWGGHQILNGSGVPCDCSGLSQEKPAMINDYFHPFHLQHIYRTCQKKKNTSEERNLFSRRLWLLRPHAAFQTAFPQGLRFVTPTFQILEPFWKPPAGADCCNPETAGIAATCAAWNVSLFSLQLCSFLFSPCSPELPRTVLSPHRALAFWPFKCKCQSFAACLLRSALPLLFASLSRPPSVCLPKCWFMQEEGKSPLLRLIFPSYTVSRCLCSPGLLTFPPPLSALATKRSSAVAQDRRVSGSFDLTAERRRESQIKHKRTQRIWVEAELICL